MLNIKTKEHILNIYFFIRLLVNLKIFSTAIAHTKHQIMDEEINPKENKIMVCCRFFNA